MPATPTDPIAAADRRPTLRALARYFLNGLIFLGPLALTVYICYQAFVWVDSWLSLPVPGAGFLLTVLLVTALGYVASSVFASGALGVVDALVGRLPFVRLVYSALRDVFGAVAGDQRRFTAPVLVETLPGSGIRVMGFVTQHSLEVFGLHDEVAVYFPFSYSFAGQPLIVPRARVMPVAARPADVLAFIVSGGIALPGHHSTPTPPPSGPA